MNDARSNFLSMWTVYDHPSDYPNSYVARLWTIGSDGRTATDSIIVADDVDKIREVLCIDMGLTCLTRDPNDDPNIIEVWI